MSDTQKVSRRNIMQLLAGASLLPIDLSQGAWAASEAKGKIQAKLFETSFQGMTAPSLESPAEMATTQVGSKLHVTLSDGHCHSFRLGYKPFFLTGDMVPSGNGQTILAGGYYDINNRAIIDRTVLGKERHYYSDAPDGTSLLSVPGAKVHGVKGHTVFAVVQFEYTSTAQDGRTEMYGKLPSPIAVLTLDQNPKTGALTLVKYHNVDTSKANGLWITCGSSLSPWGTHLSSEEYEPDAFTADKNPVFKAFSTHLYGEVVSNLKCDTNHSICVFPKG